MLRFLFLLAACGVFGERIGSARAGDSFERFARQDYALIKGEKPAEDGRP